MAWMVAPFCNISACSDSKDKAEGISLNGMAGKQREHVWSAHNSLVQSPPAADSQAIWPSHHQCCSSEWLTLVTALDQLTRLNELVSGPGHKFVATLDMDLYKRVLKLKYLDRQFKNKWVLCLGAFHTILCAIRSSYNEDHLFLFARILAIARSSSDDIDLEEVIGLHEFDHTNRVLMKPGGSIHHTSDKIIIIHLLEDVVNNTGDTTNVMDDDDEVWPQTCLVVDAMGVVQELMTVKNLKNCKEFGATYVKLIDSKAQGYDQMRVIFDNYTIPASL